MSDALRSSAWSLKWEDICPQTTIGTDLTGSILNILGTISTGNSGGQSDASLANGLIDLATGTSQINIESKLRPVASFSDLNAELSSLPTPTEKRLVQNSSTANKNSGAKKQVPETVAKNGRPSATSQNVPKSVPKAAQPTRKDSSTHAPAAQTNGRASSSSSSSAQVDRKQNGPVNGAARVSKESPAKPSRSANTPVAKKCASATAMRTSSSADIADLVSLPDVVETDSTDLLDEFETLLGQFGFSSSFTLRRPATKADSMASKANCATQLWHSIRELIETERTYVADLDALVNSYMRDVGNTDPSSAAPTETNGNEAVPDAEGKLNESQLNTLFSNLPSLFRLHAELLAEFGSIQLPDAQTDANIQALAAAGGRVGSLLMRYIQRFSEYAAYCTNFPRAIQVFSELQKAPRFAAILQQAQSRLGHCLPLPTYLLKPVQRILKYHLLVESILKRLDAAAGDACSEPRESLTAAHTALVGVAQEINELKRRQDHRERGAQICTQLLPQLRKHVTTDDVNRMHMSMTTSMYEPATEQRAVENATRSHAHVRAEYTVPGSSVPNRLNVDMTTLFGELILEDDFALYGKKPSARWRCFLFDRALIITKCEPTETGSAGRARVKTVISSANLMLIESIVDDALAFHVIPFDNPRLQHTLQARTAEQKREWCMQIKRLIIENFAGGIPERSKQLFLKMTDELQPQVRGAPLNPKAAVDLSKSRFQYPEYLLNNKRRSLLPDSLLNVSGNGSAAGAIASGGNGTLLKKRKSSLFPDLFGTLRPRGLRRSMTAYQRDGEADASKNDETQPRSTGSGPGRDDVNKMYRTLPVRGAKAKKAKAQKNATVSQEHSEPMKKRRSVESLTDVDCTLTFSDIMSEYELARARGGIHVPTQESDKNKTSHAHTFVPLNFGALRKSAVDRIDAVVDVAVDINLERQSTSSNSAASRGRGGHSRQSSSILTSNVTCPLYLVFDADSLVPSSPNNAQVQFNTSPFDSEAVKKVDQPTSKATARFASIGSNERRLVYDQACQLYLEKQSLTFDDVDAILKPLREHREQQSLPDAPTQADDNAAGGRDLESGDGEGDSAREMARSSPTDIVSQIALEQLLFRQIRRFQTGPKGLTPTNSLLALGGTLPSNSTPSESADSAYVTPLPKEANGNGKPLSKAASLRGVKFGERAKSVANDYQPYEEDDEVSLSSSSGELSPITTTAQDPSLTIVSIDTAHAHRRQLSNQLKAAMQSSSETNLLTSAPFSLPADRANFHNVDSNSRGCYTPTISRRDRFLRPFRSIFGSQRNVASEYSAEFKKSPAAVKQPPTSSKQKSTNGVSKKSSLNTPAVTAAGKPNRPAKRRNVKAKSEVNVNRETLSSTSSSRGSAEREMVVSPSLTGSISSSFRSQSLRHRSSPSSAASKKGILYRLLSYFQHASVKAQREREAVHPIAPAPPLVTAHQSSSVSTTVCRRPEIAPPPPPIPVVTIQLKGSAQMAAVNGPEKSVAPVAGPVAPNALDLVQIPFVDDGPN